MSESLSDRLIQIALEVGEEIENLKTEIDDLSRAFKGAADAADQTWSLEIMNRDYKAENEKLKTEIRQLKAFLRLALDADPNLEAKMLEQYHKSQKEE